MSKVLGFDKELARLGAIAPCGYVLGLHFRFSAPLISWCTYPNAWQEHYTANVYTLRDPVVAWAFSETGASRWRDMGIPDPFNIMGQAEEFGMKYGVSVSYGPLGSRTIGSASRNDREFKDEEIAEIMKIVEYLHNQAEPPESLTKAQQEALELIAAGHRHTAAAALLGISESALKVRLMSARNRLLARTTAEAIQRAKEHRLL